MTDIPEDALLAAYKIADIVHKASCHAWVPEAAIDAIARTIMEARDKALEDAAAYHDAKAENARARYLQLDRYSYSEEERRGWRSWKVRNDEHRTHAINIRAMKSTGREESSHTVRVLTDGEDGP